MLMGWSILRMARYVKQSKFLQQLKENEEIWSNSFQNGKFVMYLKERALLTSASSPANPFETKINWRTYDEIKPYCSDVKKSSVVLSVDDSAESNVALFACPVNPEKSNEVVEKYEGRFMDMRTAIMTLPTEQAHFVGRGYTLLTWNEECKFCQHCGSQMEKTFAGCVRVCSEKCHPHKKHQYPPMFPVAIIRVLDQSKEKVLLVRQPRHPSGMYSCIAGFMEPGETVQDCVRREIAEEAGIVVEDIQYFQSQFWPLPQPSLMLGCTATAMPDSYELDIDKSELEDARWFTKDEVKAAFNRILRNPTILADKSNTEFVIPPSGAIAHHLLLNWVEGRQHPSHL